MTIKGRIAKLEKRQPPRRDTTDPATVRASIMAKLEAVLSGESLPEPQPFDPLRADILRRLEAIANEQTTRQG